MEDFVEKIKEFCTTNPYIVGGIVFGFLCIVSGIGLSFYTFSDKKDSLVIVSDTPEENHSVEIFVIEITGAVVNPGVYEIEKGKRVDDALVLAGGLTKDADTLFMEKNINRATFVSDAQKLYIPRKNEQSDQSTANILTQDQNISNSYSDATEEKVNINTATLEQLDALWGIGQITGQNIIEHRPYSTIDELLEKKIIKSNVFEKNKEILSVY